MKRYLRIGAVVVVLAVVAAACGGGDEPSGTGTGTGGGETPTGGTLKTAMTQDFFHGLDPTQEYYSVSWAFMRCCMARTLLSYNAKPAEEGGTTPIPDLATALPTVSEDGLTWTFTIKDGVMFGDPLNREIVAQDFVNAINRLEDPEINGPGYPFYYTDIDGFTWPEGDGKVEGVTAVDEKTFEVTLTAPNPDIPYLFAMHATTPIPTELMETHYDAVDMGQFWVSSGPYQWAGWDGIDLSSKEPPSGMDIGKAYVFERNPSWDPATDEIRPAYLDSVEIQVGGEVQDLLDKVNAGALDWCIDCGATSATLNLYQNDPQLQPKLQIHTDDVLIYTGLNVFEPPFDDVHVRKAVNWALDKDAMWRLAGGPPSGQIAGHFNPPGLMGGLGIDYNPYATPNNAGDATKAQEEMKQSKYDTDGDGVCDDDACSVIALTVTGDNDAIKALEIMDKSFEPIGITLEIKPINYNALVTKCSTLAERTAFCQAGWGKDYPSAFTFFDPLLDGGENGSNYSFMGSTVEALEAAGYSGFESDGDLALPNITADIDACRALPAGAEQNECWFALDQKVTEEIAALIPRRFGTAIDVLGERIVAYSYDASSSVGAVEQMAVSGGGA
jgi:peptide/nickel transport system substrate-binding protein